MKLCVSHILYMIGEDPNNSNRMISARRSLVTERSERTGEEAQCFLSYNEQIRSKAILERGCVTYPHIQRIDPISRS